MAIQKFAAQPLVGVLQTGVYELAAEGGAISIPLTLSGVNTQWTQSAAAEGLTGEVAVSEVDMDDGPGLIYAGPVGGHVHIDWKNIDFKAQVGLTPEAADELTLAVFKNNEVVGHSDEGIAVEFDTATVEFNGTCAVGNLQTGDVLRFGFVTCESTEDALVINLAEGGEVVLS